MDERTAKKSGGSRDTRRRRNKDSQTTMDNVFILGAYGQNNLGDDALLEVFLQQFDGSTVVVNSSQPEQTSQRYGVQSLSTYWGWPRLRRPRALWRADLIVFGGGSLLKEIEGGPLARILYFVRIFAVLLFAKLAGRPTAMLGVGIGPLSHPLYRALSRYAANMTSLICVRDAASHDLLRAIGVRRPVYVTADPVFTLAIDDRQPTTDHTSGEETRRQADKETRKQADNERITLPLFLSPSLPVAQSPSLPVSQPPTVVVIPRYSLSPAEQTALAAACDHLVETIGARLRLIPFQTGFRESFDDLPATRAVIAQMRHAGAAELLELTTPREALAAIGRADMVLSARLHGLIFAAMQGVPAVALDYEVKVGSFMVETGQGWASVSLADLAAGRLPAVLDRAWASRAERGAALRECMASLRARAQQNFDLAHELAARPRGAGLLGGGALLFASMTIVNAGNYLFNLVLGRWLGPAAFADLSLVITLLLMVTLITATLQTISAKFAAAYTAAGTPERALSLRRWLGRGAWGLGALLAAALIVGAPLWQQFFRTSSAWPFALLGIGLPLYFAQGVDRGVMQGQIRFGALSLSYQAEMWVRLIAAIAFVALGWAVNGAVIGVTLSLVATWLVGFTIYDLRRPRGSRQGALDAGERREVWSFAVPVVAALIGQVLINNSDILIVKHFFGAEPAGHYAALALIGRIVFFATASVVAVMFPIVAQKHQRGEPHRHLLWAALGLVAAVSAGVIAATLLVPELLVRMLFGAAYLPIAPLLWLYAIATALYALANVVINYRLSASAGGGSALAVLAGLAQVAGLWLFHSSLEQVVLVQVYLMGGLLGALLVWDWWGTKNREPRTENRHSGSGSRFLVLGSFFHRRWRSLLFGTVTLALLLLMWQVARADAPTASHPAQQQLTLIMPSLADSEAEHASGAYIPGIGAVITLDVLRGPNTIPDKPAHLGVRDWAIYLMQTFGPQLNAVPPTEQIALSAEYYDYTNTVYHQLVILCHPADVADASKYTIWLDGKPFDQAAAALAAPEASSPDAAAPPAPTTAAPPAAPTVAAPAEPTTAASAPPVAATPAAPAQTAAAATPAPAASAPISSTGPLSQTFTFDDPQASAQDWQSVSGTWAFAEQGYDQTELGKYDLATLLNRPVGASYRIQVDVKFIEGDMGAGLIFNVPAGSVKSGGQMISYTGQGSYLQWGSFNDAGEFKFQGGSNVPSGADGKWHTLAVRVNGKTYSASLDGQPLGQDIPLVQPAGGRFGLFVSTSHVRFDNLKIESN
jgi:polysaccharide pyruvyl transferase CsaB